MGKRNEHPTGCVVKRFPRTLSTARSTSIGNPIVVPDGAFSNLPFPVGL
jgi:hypothetical protein